ncbi:tyrosine-type recombinase/integrase [Clostridium botulinum]|uniref:tyrosine-type recombinase/integrase n=1 Tax=Clostridium botulinum TaxID=1491 RepID=UPI000773CCAD|nr:tyrosine-type recombinase/integrase [Clostridium botulinum]
MQSNTTCPLVEQYLGYLVVIKGHSDNTVKEYRTDLLMFFNYIMNLRNITIINENFAQADLEFIKSITLHDMYSLSVVGKGNKERKIFLTPAAKKAINDWLHIRNSINVNTNALFISRNNNRITTRAIQNIVKKYVITSGLDPKSISTHKLRHTAATLMYKYGRVDIRSLQQILGHESVATTEIYTHIDEHQLQSAVNSNPLAMMFS